MAVGFAWSLRSLVDRSGQRHSITGRFLPPALGFAAQRGVYPATAAFPVGSSDADDTSDGAFEAFFRSHQHDIFGFLWRLTGDEQVAHDLTQETFVRAWQQFAKVRAYEQPRAWLFRIATNLAIDHQRRRATPVRSASPLDETIAATDPALRLIERLDERDAVREAMLALPMRQRTALVLRVVYDLSCEEIAATLGISVAAARMTLSRARAQFRERYTRTGGRP